jgi:hypothetical protein
MTTHTLIRCQACGDPTPWHREGCPVLMAKHAAISMNVNSNQAGLNEKANALPFCDTRAAGYAEQGET